MLIVEGSIPEPVRLRSLEGMFEERKRVFVDLLGWNVPVVDGRFEVDQWDTADARYLIIADQKGRHFGSARLLPTSRPHILSRLFPQLCSGPIPVGPQIAEITRFCLGRNQSASERRVTRNRLVTALVRDALERGIQIYTGVAEMAWLQQILAFGWICRPLGVPQKFGSALIGALAIEIDRDTPALLEANGIWIDEAEREPLVREAA